MPMIVFRNPPAAQTSNTESILARYFFRIPNPQPEIKEIQDPEKLIDDPQPAGASTEERASSP